MKISNETLAILKHFATLNPGMVFEEGNTLLSQTINKTIRAEVEVKEQFPTSFGVANLAQMINVLSIIDEPEIEFQEEGIEISSPDGMQRIKYFYSNPVLIKQENKKFKGLKGLKITAEFLLQKEILTKINKVCSVIGCNDICFFNEGKDLFVACMDKKLPNSNRYKIEIGQYNGDTDFKAYIKRQNLNILAEDYNVTIIARGLAVFDAVNSAYDKLQFLVGIEEDSELGPTE